MRIELSKSEIKEYKEIIFEELELLASTNLYQSKL